MRRGAGVSERGLRHVVIAGGGTAGWMAAAALGVLSDLEVTLIESEEIGTVGVGEATIPQIRLFNAAVGLDEGEFFRATRGSYKLGIMFEGWSGEGSRYMHAFGPTGAAHGVLPFHHHWLHARSAGLARDFGAYSLNRVAATAGRVPSPLGRGDEPQSPYAYHFDAALYAKLLRAHAEAAGVRRVEGRIVDVVLSSDGEAVEALVLASGSRIPADFFVDCTGFRAVLLEALAPREFDNWSHWLPCDRAWAVPCAAAGDFTPYTRATARQAGWQWRIPLQHRIGNGYVFCSRFCDEEDARRVLLANLDGEPESDPRLLSFTTGTRRRHWVGNCVALGLAAGFMEPLESTSIHLVQSSIARLLQLLPSDPRATCCAVEFNRQAQSEWCRIRDFLILHYHANGRQGEPFWDERRAAALPDTLVEQLELWRHTATVSRRDEDLFTLEGWSQVLIGQNILPACVHPLAAGAEPEALRARLDAILARHAAAVERMPTHAAALRQAMMTEPQRKRA
ncbi:tryptophan halogenase family protein [Qipengyuania thermophila]|uniref:tryptophan halogenase family protein n=1 Tax=Qipengyuania thermophila TaxID=2509361 RepID=UPI0028F439A5|nr:tryptophan halogenase family protein [Qipengyuania thermophila]